MCTNERQKCQLAFQPLIYKKSWYGNLRGIHMHTTQTAIMDWVAAEINRHSLDAGCLCIAFPEAGPLTGLG